MTDLFQKVVLFITKNIFGLFITTIVSFVFKCLLKLLIVAFNYMLIVNIFIYSVIFYIVYFLWFNFYEIKSFFTNVKIKAMYLHKSLQHLSSDAVINGEKQVVKDYKFRSKSKK
jgi:hypothetical protein